MSELRETAASWGTAAGRLTWLRPWDVTLDEGSPPPGRWFLGGTLNLAVNCLDRHLPTRGDAVAIYWEGEPGDRRMITYRELHDEVSRLARALEGLGVGAGDLVALHLGWVPEAVAAILACGRLGAVHSILPVPLPTEALADRLDVLRPRVLFTQDAAWRRGEQIPLKARADDALAALSAPGVVEHQVVVRRTGAEIDWYEGDCWYDELVAKPGGADDDGLSPPRAFPSDHPLFVEFLAQHQHAPIRIVHRTAGVLVHASEFHRLAFTRSPGDVLWCAVEISHDVAITHGIYGPLSCGASAVMYEGALDTPTPTRCWEIMERYGVQTFLTMAPVVHHLHHWWRGGPSSDRLRTLRLVVTCGTPLDPAAARWLREIGQGEMQLADAWGQLELSGLNYVDPPPQGPGTVPDLGLDIVDEQGCSVPMGDPGELVVRRPFPGVFLKLEGHPDADLRYWRYWAQWPGTYATGDLARARVDGGIEFLGRLDRVAKISGQLVWLEDVRDVLIEHPFVVEAEVTATVDVRGEPMLAAWLVLEPEIDPDPALTDDVRRHVAETLGGLARPGRVRYVESFPAGVSRLALRQALGRLTHESAYAVFAVPEARLLAELSSPRVLQLRPRPSRDGGRRSLRLPNVVST